jgi:hypothetical protein
MTIKTKYNKEDTIWYMRSNQPVQGLIQKIEIIVDKGVYIVYSGNWVNTQWQFSENEKRCFPSKEALLQSL